MLSFVNLNWITMDFKCDFKLRPRPTETFSVITLEIPSGISPEIAFGMPPRVLWLLLEFFSRFLQEFILGFLLQFLLRFTQKLFLGFLLELFQTASRSSSGTPSDILPVFCSWFFQKSTRWFSLGVSQIPSGVHDGIPRDFLREPSRNKFQDTFRGSFSEYTSRNPNRRFSLGFSQKFFSGIASRIPSGNPAGTPFKLSSEFSSGIPSGFLQQFHPRFL